eukprot:1158690-Pelagomonas_calceolata.AAC.8
MRGNDGHPKECHGDNPFLSFHGVPARQTYVSLPWMEPLCVTGVLAIVLLAIVLLAIALLAIVLVFLQS